MTPAFPLSGPILPRTVTGLVVAASAIGLLSIPVGIYDDSILLVGARLVGHGQTPYLDFYAHYGPLGYTILAFLVRLFADPGLALRAGEVAFLAGLAVLLHAGLESLQRGSPLREHPVPVLVLAFSRVSMHPAFFGFAFAAAALVLFILGRNGQRSSRRTLFGAGAGVALAAAALTRPAFAAYVAGALLVLEAVLGSPRPAHGAARLSTLGVVFGAAVLTTAVLGLSLYPAVTPAKAFDATVLVPGRLLAEGGRYLDPDFLPTRGTLARGIATGAALFVTTIAWTIAVPGVRVLAFAAGGSLAGGLLPLLLAYSDRRGRDAALVALALFALSALVVFSGREALRQSPLLRASATFGLPAAAFGHYFWARADGPHLVPLLTLALTGAALLLLRIPPSRGAALLALFLFADLSASPAPAVSLEMPSWKARLQPLYVPAAKLFKREVVAKLLPWRCTVPPDDAREAVALADRLADPRSRFVAVGTSQAWSFGNPAQLFLISSRLPYTKWFHYDPGVQSSEKVQKEMERELEASGSRTAVVWRAGKYLWGGESLRRGSRSPFDDAFDRLYPFTAAKFGEYEVRMRDSASSAGLPPGSR